VLYLSDLLGGTRLDLPHQLAHTGRGIAWHLALSFCEVEDATEHGEGVSDGVRCLSSAKCLTDEEEDILFGNRSERLVPEERC